MFWDNADWEQAIIACGSHFLTPYYLFSSRPLQSAMAALPRVSRGIPIKHFFSFKTTPVAPVIADWLATGQPVEVVSEYEYKSVVKLGAKQSSILINGPRKASWLPSVSAGSWIHIDSKSEADSIMNNPALLQGNRFGLRIAVREMRDPDDSRYTGQFGIPGSEIASIIESFEKRRVSLDSIHFHLRSNVPRVDSYLKAICEIADLCQSIGWFPRYLDIGGGAPATGEIPRSGNKQVWSLVDLADGVGKAIREQMDWVTEIWMENGRAVTESSGVLVTRVCDIKTLDGCRYIICDGGKVNQALVADWDRHRIFTLPHRASSNVETCFCGPTCMAWDWLERGRFPRDISIGDLVVWLDAGAYHTSFETAFSHPLASIVWINNQGEPKEVRQRQSLDNWFQQIGGHSR